MNLPDNFKLFNDLDRSTPVPERARICAERHMKNYFIIYWKMSEGMAGPAKENVEIVAKDEADSCWVRKENVEHA